MNIFLDMVGCRLNQSELETFAWQFRAAGHHLVARPAQADIAVINTCIVTGAAASDSRQRIRQAAHCSDTRVVVTGCWATLEPDQAAKIPGVIEVINNQNKDRLVALVLQTSGLDYDHNSIERKPIPGARMRTRAFIKAQDGCNNRCAFCITRIARGPSRSRAIIDVVEDINAALRGGAQEIVLSGVHLGAWGLDFSPRLHLHQLLQAILNQTDTARLRLSSLEPWDLTSEFFNLWQDPRLCRHLHLPLQSGCAATLRRMMRKTSPDSFARLLGSARTAIPNVAITTDIMVGFPGETQAEFDESLAFVKQMQFSGGHVFTYSERPGTLAAQMPDAVAFAERKARNAQMQFVVQETGIAFQQNFLGTQQNVLWERAKQNEGQGWELSGLTDNNLRVHSHAQHRLWNQITPVNLTGLTQHGLLGTLSP